MPSEKSKMLEGEWYDPADPELRQDRERARSLCMALSPATPAGRLHLIRELFAAPVDVAVTPPFHCDYGYNIRVGTNVYFNFNCVLLDVCPIFIGSNTLFGPGVHVYTVNHPMEAEKRRSGLEAGKPIRIGEDVWIGGASVICAGVEIGDRTVVGAGSIVTRSLPSDVFAAGNPCRVIKQL
jgi:maltose O-acetyltransferase